MVSGSWPILHVSRNNLEGKTVLIMTQVNKVMLKAHQPTAVESFLLLFYLAM